MLNLFLTISGDQILQRIVCPVSCFISDHQLMRASGECSSSSSAGGGSVDRLLPGHQAGQGGQKVSSTYAGLRKQRSRVKLVDNL